MAGSFPRTSESVSKLATRTDDVKQKTRTKSAT